MQDLIQNIGVTSCQVAQRNINWYFLGVLQHENKDTCEKQLGKVCGLLQQYDISLKIFWPHCI